jgi:SAM-dependent methyltransferase
MAVDFGRTSADYSRYRPGFPQLFYDKLRERGLLRAGLRVLDLGTGTGVIARSVAGMGCSVTGVDVSEEQLSAARELDRQRGVRVEYLCRPAENTDLPDGSFDLIIAGQCWHWFSRPRVAAECRRILVSGGALVIGHFDWLPLPGTVAGATEELILKHNPSCPLAGSTGVYPDWFADVATAGFTRLESWTFDLSVPFSHESWRGRIRASAGVAASLPAEAVRRFDEELRSLLAAGYPDEPLEVPHRVFSLAGIKPGF